MDGRSTSDRTSQPDQALRGFGFELNRKDGTFLSVTASVLQVLGRSAEDVMKLTGGLAGLAVPEEREHLAKALAAKGDNIPLAFQAQGVAGERLALQGGLGRSGKDGRTFGYLLAAPLPARSGLRNQRNVDLAMAAAKVGTFEWDIENGTVWWGPELKALYGLPPDAPIRSFEDWQRMVHPDDWPSMAKILEDGLREPELRTEFRIVRPDGSVAWIAARSLIEFVGDRPVWMTGANIDITDSKMREKALADSEERLRLAQSAGRIGIWDWNLETGETIFNDFYYRLYRLPPEGGDSYEAFLARVHPDDRAKVDAGMQAALAGGPAYDVRYRLTRADGETRWFAARGEVRFDADHRPVRALGTVRDITDAHRAEERQILLAREIDHRAKNALMLASSIVYLTAETTEQPARFVATVQKRIEALAHAHNLLADNRWEGATVRRILEEELRPHAGRRWSATGPDVMLRADAAMSFAMTVHELVTNAVKYGALAVPDGSVSIHWRREPDGGLALAWQERGGRPPPQSPRQGFGSRLIGEMIPAQHGGSVELALEPDGVRCLITMPGRECLAP